MNKYRLSIPFKISDMDYKFMEDAETEIIIEARSLYEAREKAKTLIMKIVGTEDSNDE